MRFHHYWLVSLCLKQGARIDDRDNKGMTVVHFACLSGQIGVISFLKHHGAKLDVRDDKGKTPLMVAAQSNQHIVAFLFECVSSRHLVGF